MYILTSVWVLCTLNPGRNLHFNVFYAENLKNAKSGVSYIATKRWSSVLFTEKNIFFTFVHLFALQTAGKIRQIHEYFSNSGRHSNYLPIFGSIFTTIQLLPHFFCFVTLKPKPICNFVVYLMNIH